jgi:BirA family biotin operon repressor/biotin-[acetyl-CoA-carboxylase] ligase
LAYSPVIECIGQTLIELSTTESTNNYAMGLIRSGKASHGLLITAEEQTAGKGQRGRHWKAPRGENMLMTLVLNPLGLALNKQFYLSAAVALGCYNFFKNLAGEEPTRIKWPNDLYWQDRKAGGILIENNILSNATLDGTTYKEQWKWAVVGIGININQTSFPSDLPNPVSLKQVTGKNHDIADLVNGLTSSLKVYLQLIVDGEWDRLMQAYEEALYKKGEEVRLKKDNAVFQTRIKGVNDRGQLLTKDTMARAFDSGEVEWVK